MGRVLAPVGKEGEGGRRWARRGKGSELERNISWCGWRAIARGVIQNTRVEGASEADAVVAPTPAPRPRSS